MNRQPFYGIKLRVFLRKVLVQGIYKLLAADAVYNTSLFQRFHPGKTGSQHSASSSHQDIAVLISARSSSPISVSFVTCMNSSSF